MDYDFSESDKSFGTEYAGLCCLLRAKRFDERCRAFLRERPLGPVVNLGAGLDTTFNRVDNGSVRWYNIDLPDAMAFRQRFVPAHARCVDLALSMFDDSWFDEVESADGGVLVLAGGLFYYFRENQVRDLVCRIVERFPSGEIFFDAQSRAAVRVSNRMVRKTGNEGSEMYFFVNDARKLKSWSPGIREVECVPFFDGMWKERRFKLSSRVNMWGLDKLKMGFLVSVKWQG
jgi:O-methyltransferase involved in polyketide biosynthesis